MNNQTKLFKALVDLNVYLKKLSEDLMDLREMNSDDRESYYYAGRSYQLSDCIVLVEDILEKNIPVEKVADKKLVKEVITRFYK